MLCVEGDGRIQVNWEVFPIPNVWVDDSGYVEADRRRRNCSQENLK